MQGDGEALAIHDVIGLFSDHELIVGGKNGSFVIKIAVSIYRQELSLSELFEIFLFDKDCRLAWIESLDPSPRCGPHHQLGYFGLFAIPTLEILKNHHAAALVIINDDTSHICLWCGC